MQKLSQSQLITLLVAFIFSLSACSHVTESANSQNPTTDKSAQFFAQLQTLCGQRFVGKSSFPANPDDSFYGKKLVADFKVCNDKQVRVPFIVGEDHSRTWIFTQTENGLQLKHDHRHHDGTPDEITNYGGYANNLGSANSQFFPADEFTAKLLPPAATNVWNIALSEDGQELTYYLERHNKPRFKAKLIREK